MINNKLILPNLLKHLRTEAELQPTEQRISLKYRHRSRLSTSFVTTLSFAMVIQDSHFYNAAENLAVSNYVYIVHLLMLVSQNVPKAQGMQVSSNCIWSGYER